MDVETPNRYSRSICSIGIVRVDGEEDPVRLHYLVNPCDEFDVANIAIHGIRPADVADAPSLAELWPSIEPYFTGCLLVAHNALFDLPVIRKALLRENLFAENWRYLCTLEKSRRHIPKTAFGSHKLNDLCAGLNIPLEHHHNALDDAELNLGWTKVYAQADGTVSNLQLSPGFYASSGSAALALVNNQTDIVADFREKSLRHTHQGTDAAVVFDAFPGRVFRAHVTSSDAGILAGQEAVNGQLSEPETSNRWVRDAQRMRIHVALDEELPKHLPTGARATVQLYNSEGPFARFFSGMQIHLVSLLHYVY